MVGDAGLVVPGRYSLSVNTKMEVMAQMTKTAGIVLYPDFEELDAVGPYEVIGMLGKLDPDWRVVMIAENAGPVRSLSGLNVIADYGFDDAPTLDVILVPGGLGSRKAVDDPRLVDYVRNAGLSATWVTSVCTGAMILHRAGFLAGRPATTHWGAIHELKALGGVRDSVDVVALEDNFRQVADLWRKFYEYMGVEQAWSVASFSLSPWVSARLERSPVRRMRLSTTALKACE